MSTAIFIERCIQKQTYVARWMLPDLSMYPEVLPIIHGSVIFSYGRIVLHKYSKIKSLNFIYLMYRMVLSSYMHSCCFIMA